MKAETIMIIRSVAVEARTAPDRFTRCLVVLIALGLAWQVLRPHVTPLTVEASRDTVGVNIERIGGRFLTDGAIPMKCTR